MPNAKTDSAFAAHLKPKLAAMLHAVGLDVEYHRAEGNTLTFRDPESGADVDVLDLVGGFGATFLGHNHPEIAACVRSVLEARRPVHAQASVRGVAGRLAERLSARVGQVTGRRYVVTLGNSGAEAVEAAIKHAELERRARLERILRRIDEAARDASAGGQAAVQSAREAVLAIFDRPPVFLAMARAFHGKTSGALQLTYPPRYREPWAAVGPRTAFLPVDDIAAIGDTVRRHEIEYLEPVLDQNGRLTLTPRRFANIAAAFVEPVQGEGGVHSIGAPYLAALRRAADEAGFPLVMDEIQCGMGRTGTFLASEPAGTRADYYLFSKSLGGGLAKISAMLVDAGRYASGFDLLHTSTFADDDLSATVALKTLDIIERDNEAVIRACRDQGDYLIGRLRELQARFPNEIAAVRGRGLMIGFELATRDGSLSPLLRVLSAQSGLAPLVAGYLLHEERIRVAPTLGGGCTIRIEPSAFVTRSECDSVIAAFGRLCAALHQADVYRLTRFLVGRARESKAPAPLPRVGRAAPPPAKAQSPRVGFLLHFLEPGDLRRWEPGLRALGDEECRRFIQRTRPCFDPFIAGRTALRSATGMEARIAVIGLPFLPGEAVAAMRAGDGWVRDLVDKGIELARAEGCTILGFGAYTSIVTDNCRSVVAPGMTVTSGNALTAAAALDALFQAARALEGPRRLGVVGASGNIGRVLAEVAAAEVDELVLVGRPQAVERLHRAASEVSHNGTRVSVATDLDALRKCNLILSATNAARPVIQPGHIAEGPVVIVDIAVPQDVDARVAVERPDAIILNGGLVRPPAGQQLDFDGSRLAAGEIYGCMAEAVLLGFAGGDRPWSYGPLTAAGVREARDAARTHGFSFDPSPRRDPRDRGQHHPEDSQRPVGILEPL